MNLRVDFDRDAFKPLNDVEKGNNSLKRAQDIEFNAKQQIDQHYESVTRL